jgi:uncharacterized protein
MHPSDPQECAIPKSDHRDGLVRAGRVVIRIQLLPTPTADLIWQRLPIYTTAETWGHLIHAEIPLKTGRENPALQNLIPGQLAFWSEQNRIMIGYGETPLSGPGEIRLPSPCNIWARALDDVRDLSGVTGGERFVVLKADS